MKIRTIVGGIQAVELIQILLEEDTSLDSILMRGTKDGFEIMIFNPSPSVMKLLSSNSKIDYYPDDFSTDLDNAVTNEFSSAETSSEEICVSNSSVMECMPKIPSFEDTLKAIDYNYPIRSRVASILSIMKWDWLDSGYRKEVFEYVSFIMERKLPNEFILFKHNISFDFFSSILDKYLEDPFHLWNKMDYISKPRYKPVKVKASTFLTELQAVILTKEEYLKVYS